MGSDVDWAYFSEEEPYMNNRKLMLNRGKVMGGTSATNAMIFIRGHWLDFDHWNYLGNEGWSYKEVLPFFKKSEDNVQGENEFRGVGGPIRVDNYAVFTKASPSSSAFVEAGVELGLRGGSDWDFNTGDTANSVGHYQFNITSDIQRCSSATGYINPIVGKDNFTAETFAHATKILCENGRAVGVQYLKDGQTKEVRANAEIVICTGAFDAPKLLLLSGIGPAETLRKFGIDVVADLPGVGENLQDHLRLPILFTSKQQQPVPTFLAEAGLCYRTRDGLPTAAPDLQMNFNATVPGLTPEGLPFDPFQTPSLTFMPIISRPSSVGYVTLRSNDPLAPSVIQENYLQTEADMRVQLKAIELIRALAHTRAFSEFADAEAVPGADKSESELREYVKNEGQTIWHPVGTCKMGIDRMAVVDPRLRVYGIDGLRVADASIMPTIVSANPNAAIWMIGEKAADMIKQDNR